MCVCVCVLGPFRSISNRAPFVKIIAGAILTRLEAAIIHWAYYVPSPPMLPPPPWALKTKFFLLINCFCLSFFSVSFPFLHVEMIPNWSSSSFIVFYNPSTPSALADPIHYLPFGSIFAQLWWILRGMLHIVWIISAKWNWLAAASGVAARLLQFTSILLIPPSFIFDRLEFFPFASIGRTCVQESQPNWNRIQRNTFKAYLTFFSPFRQ